MKLYRIYYNRSIDWPQCWSVDEGDQSSEITVCGILIYGCTLSSKVLPPKQRGASDPQKAPSAWLEVAGALSIERGFAVFRGVEQPVSSSAS